MTKERRLSILVTVTLITPAVLLLALVAASNSLTVAKADGITAQEGSLNPAGFAYEINPDTHGNLWISDDGANEVWQVHPATGVVTTYSGLDNASDARMDAAGMVWWTNAGSTDLGRISPGTSTVTIWTIPGIGNLWGIAFDDAGRVWTTNFMGGVVYRFTPASTEVCTYTVPDAGASSYILAQGGDIWLGDGQNHRILKLDPSANLFTIWQLAGGAHPQGLALEANGNLWWADENLPVLAQLQPGVGRMTAYTLPVGTQPEMIALSQGRVWYTEIFSGSVGMLNPAAATGASSTPVKTTAAVTPACSNVGAGTSTPVLSSTHTLTWTPTVYNQLVKSGGWTVYQMPPGGSPWGITVSDRAVWIVDQGRQKLAWLPESTYIYLPLIIR
jgi:virginiamycin B lyase